MTDISMCDNPNCEIKDFCFRHLADRDDYQSYMTITKHVDNSDDCEHFLECATKDALDRLNRINR